MKACVCPSGNLLFLSKLQNNRDRSKGTITIFCHLGRYEPSSPTTKELHGYFERIRESLKDYNSYPYLMAGYLKEKKHLPQTVTTT